MGATARRAAGSSHVAGPWHPGTHLSQPSFARRREAFEQAKITLITFGKERRQPIFKGDLPYVAKGQHVPALPPHQLGPEVAGVKVDQPLRLQAQELAGLSQATHTTKDLDDRRPRDHRQTQKVAFGPASGRQPCVGGVERSASSSPSSASAGSC